MDERQTTQVTSVTLQGGPPWGFRLFGGNGEPLVLSKIRKQSQASEAGLQEGDIVIAINGYGCDGMTHSTAMQLIDTSGDVITFMVLRGGYSAEDVRRTLQLMAHSLKTLPESQRRRSSGQQHDLMASSLSENKARDLMTSSVNGSKNIDPFSTSGNHINESSNESFSVQPSKFNPRAGPAVWTPSQMKVNAPPSVGVSQNNDKSITFSFGLSDNKENAAPRFVPSKIATPAKINSSVVKDISVQQAVWKPSNIISAPVTRLPIYDDYADNNRDVMSPDFTSQEVQNTILREKPTNLLLSRVVTEGSGSESGSESPSFANRKKKVFADSSFYDDPSQNYPTIEEQIKMARQVALSLLAPANKKARGHQMFIKRRQKSERWVAGTQEEDSDSDSAEDKFYQVDPWKRGVWKPKGNKLGGPTFSDGSKNLPSGIWTAPLVPEGKETKALSADEVERMRLYSQKNQHTNVSPQMCFNIANDLKKMKGRGGQIFAKRQAKSEKWVVAGGECGEEEETQQPQPLLQSSRPNKDFMAKLEGTLANRKPPEQPDAVAKQQALHNAPPTAPRNRLKEMIDPPKAKITPWDAAAEYGTIEPAFEHLGTYFKQRDALDSQGDEGLSPGSINSPATPLNPYSSTTPFTPQKTSPPFKSVQVLPPSSDNNGDRLTRANNFSTDIPQVAKPAGFRPVRFNVGGADKTVPSLDNSQALGRQVSADMGYCDL